MPRNLYLCEGFEAVLFNSFMKKSFYIFIFLIILVLTFSCGKEDKKLESPNSSEVAFNPNKDSEIQKYNLELRKARSHRFPCDTISVIEYVIENYPKGTYLLETDKTTINTLPKPAVIYYTDKNGSNYIFAVITKSRSGERLVEIKNLIGYNESFIDLDSTKLGTPFLFLVLLECKKDYLLPVWEAVIPSHGGFKDFSLKNWDVKGTFYVETEFYYAQGIGIINYNYFLIDGIRTKPHLLMTYDGLDFKRTIANVNNDKFPDYYEHIFVSVSDKIYSKDSVAFIWREKDSVYVNTRNSKQTRPY